MQRFCCSESIIMARAKSKKKGKTPGTVDTTEADKATPKSIIVYRGDVGGKVRGLMHEWRRVFLPWSSKKLHAKRNSLKDYLHIASTFSVSHLHLLTVPSQGTSLRIMRFPSGPTVSLRIDSFKLRDDIVGSQRRPAPVNGPAYDVAPIVVLNNFNQANRTPEVALLESTFQSLFPSLNIHLVKPGEVQRVALFHYDPANGTVEMRHFFIQPKSVGISKTVKKLLEGRLPTKLGTLEQVDDVLDKEGAWSDTDGEGEEVNLAKPFRSHREQCRIKLVEIGPRMTFRLMKIESGFAGGEVMYHRTVKKTPKQVATTAMRVKQRGTEKKSRRAAQDANVQRKKDEREERVNNKKRRREERERENPGDGSDGDDDDDEGESGKRGHRFEEVQDE
jgi:ribosome biogenesis protein SSF1/2